MKTQLVTTTIGLGLLLFGLGTLSYSFGPIVMSELRYLIKDSASAQIQQLLLGQASGETTPETASEQEIQPVDSEFGIVIPKIEANAPIVAGVDPYDANIYQRELTKGVAQAKGTGFPGQNKTMFLFAHASGDITMARRYNSIFYLLNKMEVGDEIKIYYQGAPYTYQVNQTKEVTPEAVSFLKNDPSADLILMTCTPPGTTWRRLLVLASLVN